MRSRRILFISFGELGGTSTLRGEELSRGLRDLGWDARIAVPATLRNREIGKTRDVEPFYFDSSQLRFFRELRRLTRAFDPLFVHFLNPKEKAMAIATMLRRIKYVLDWEDWSTFWKSSSVVRAYEDLRSGVLIRRAGLVVTASRWLGEYIHMRFGRESLYLPYACLPRRFPEPRVGHEGSVVVGMGNLYSSWDHDLFVEAMGQLKQRGIEPRARWIGDGEDMQRTRQRVEALGLTRFELPGYLDWDLMLRELREAYCLVFPIRRNLLNLARCPFKCFQFAQSGRPVITSDVGEVRSILGDLATYVEPTAQGYAEGIARCLEEGRQEDMKYDLTSHRWDLRAKDLALALEGVS